MPQYFASFVPGAEPIVSAILGARNFPIRSLSSGAVEFAAPEPYSSLRLFCFHNIFQILYTVPAPPTKSGLETFVRSLPGAPVDWPGARGKGKTFRVVTSCQNQLSSVDKASRAALERKLAAVTSQRVDRSLPDREFWAVVRRQEEEGSGGRAYFLKRLSRHKAYDKLLHPGELHPELAYMLCWLTDPRPQDVVLDPFCGYGAIPFQRCTRFPYTKILAFDRDPAPLAVARKKLEGKAAVSLSQRDALHTRLEPGTIDSIITDPPWGLYEDLGRELEGFYRDMLQEFSRLLRPGGRAVVLTAGKRELLAAAEPIPGGHASQTLLLNGRYDILVSGKKCGIFVFGTG